MREWRVFSQGRPPVWRHEVNSALLPSCPSTHPAHPHPLAQRRHCVEGGNPRYVLLRTRNLYNRQAPTEVIRVTRVVVHPNYNQQGLVENDAALLVLAQASKAQPVTMAGTKLALNATDKLLVAGWGATSERNDQSDVLL